MDSNSSVFKRIALRTGVILLGIAVVLYLADYALLRYRIVRNLAPYGNVTVNVYYAVPQKTGRTEYDFDSAQQETCVNSVLPHMGYAPCWYLRKHSDKQIKL
jgi:hypothetical protein